MAEVNKSVLVTHSAAQMFALIEAVERYPEFLPWCSGTEIMMRDRQITRATIHINYHGVSQSFSTENAKREPHLMEIALIKGPFRTLHGSWRFTDLGGAGSKVELSLRYEFANRVLERLIGPVFGRIANNLVEAFVTRARNIHG